MPSRTINQVLAFSQAHGPTIMASNTLEKFSEEELSFYDFSYIVKWTNIVEEEEVITAIEGTKHHAKESITWSLS